MKKPRFGDGTSIYYLALVMSVVVLIAFGLSGISTTASLIVSLLWILFCEKFVDPWFFPVAKAKYSWKSTNSILVAFDSMPIWMERDGKTIGLEPKNNKGKKTIWIYDHARMGVDRTLNGFDVTMVDLNAGVINAKHTPDGFLVYWDKSEPTWKVVGEKKVAK